MSKFQRQEGKNKPKYSCELLIKYKQEKISAGDQTNKCPI